MKYNIKIVNPLEIDKWDEMILSNNEYSFFHSTYWAKVLQESYRFKPKYFSIIENKQLLSVIPIMEIRSKVTGNKGVSLPYTDFCRPIVKDKSHFDDTLHKIIDYGTLNNWKCFEIRGDNKYLNEFGHSMCYLEHIINLDYNIDQIYSSFRNSTKSNIKKAKKNNVNTIICNSWDSLKKFYDMNCMTRRYHGLPPQPIAFFNNIYKYIINKNRGFCILAYYQDHCIAGGVFFHFGKKAIYKYASWDRKYQFLRPNNVITWEAIKWFVNRKYELISFGRSDPNNKGLVQYKNGWGTQTIFLKYYKYYFKKSCYIESHSEIPSILTNLFKMMPIPVLKIIGNNTYKHMY